jgi:hypothetical protein
LSAEEGGKLSESREKRDEFLTPPQSNTSRGEPKAKLLGAFSLVRFFGASKEMNEYFYSSGFRLSPEGQAQHNR